MRLLMKMSVLVVGMVLAGCGTVGQRRAGIENYDEVSPTLYRGAQPTEEGFRTLASYGVKTVINLRDSDDAREAALVRGAGMAYVHLPWDAARVTEAEAEQFLAVLGEAQGPVFVHCLAGRDRTGLAVAAYRVRVQGWTLEAALRDLNAHGHNWVLYPNVRAAITGLARTPAAAGERAVAAEGVSEAGARDGVWTQ